MVTWSVIISIATYLQEIFHMSSAFYLQRLIKAVKAWTYCLQSNIQSDPGIYKAPISSCLLKGADETEKLPKMSVHDSNWERQKSSD